MEKPYHSGKGQNDPSRKLGDKANTFQKHLEEAIVAPIEKYLGLRKD